MGNLLIEHMFVDIGMGIDMDQRHRPVFLGNGAQHRQAKRMIAPHGQWHHIVLQHLVVKGGDPAHRILQVKSVDRYVANICHLKRLKWGRTGPHIVGADHRAFGPDLARPKPGARAKAGTNVHRDADKGRIQSFGRLLCRQPHKRARPCKARHFIAPKRLVFHHIPHVVMIC